MEEKMNVEQFKNELTKLIDRFEKDNGCIVNNLFIETDTDLGFSLLTEPQQERKRLFAIKIS
jgi:hypothetical protein